MRPLRRAALCASLWLGLLRFDISHVRAAPPSPVVGDAASVDTYESIRASLIVSPHGATAVDLLPGAVVEGYELVERTALLGVCDHIGDARVARRKSIGDGGATRKCRDGEALIALDDPKKRKDVMIVDKGSNEAVVEVHVDGDAAGVAVCPIGKKLSVVRGSTDPGGASSSDDDGNLLIPEGPSLEYQCLLDDIDLIYVNRNYRLRRKFAAGSHGEVWRASKKRDDGEEDTFILKRLFVEKGDLMIEMGLREAHFGKLLAQEPHVARFVEYFFRAASSSTNHEAPVQGVGNRAHSANSPRPLPATVDGSQPKHSPHHPPGGHTQDLWLVFYDEGISLRHYLYSSKESAHTAVLFEPSGFWRRLRMDTHGEDVLREIMRQLLEGVAALHDRGITHRDIKPSNILVHLQRSANDQTSTQMTPPTVKLADFGSAVDEYTVRHLYGDNGPTQSEETREYQAPEVLFSDFGAPYDFGYPLSYDMWSVGVVFLEMVLGSPQVFMISPRARAKLDAKLRDKDEAIKLKSYLLHVLTKEFCIFQPSPHDLQRLWNQYALVSDSCHFGRFNTTVVERDPMHIGLRNPWGLDLLWRMLQWNPSQRISARAALKHAFFAGPYICNETGRKFATASELRMHQAYLEIQRSREKEMAFIVRPKYELPDVFKCPHCDRNFSTIASCEQHLVARKHNEAAGTHFCDHDHETIGIGIRGDTQTHSNDEANASIGIALFQGKRKYMEDFVVVQRFEKWRASIYAVIDGHLGTGAADFIRTSLPSTLNKRFESLDLAKNTGAIEQKTFLERVMLRRLFLELHRGFVESTEKPEGDPDFSGCTLTLVIHLEDEGRILCANVGDSRAIFVTSSGAVPLSTDHWPDVEEERLRIESSGGFVSFEGLWRVVGQLAVSRSIGDRHLRKYVTAEPSIREFTVNESGVLVVASDGVWEAMDNRDVTRFVNERRRVSKSLHALTSDLVQEAFLRGSLDNLAAILVDVQQSQLK